MASGQSIRVRPSSSTCPSPFGYMSFSFILRKAFPITAIMLSLGMAGVLSAQSINLSFNSTITFPNFPQYPYSSDYVQCVAPLVQQYENGLVQLQNVYEQQKLLFVQKRGQSRIQAWMIPERSARSRAIRDSDKAYRDAVRELDRWFRDQEKTIKRQFNDTENTCDDRFDTDVDSLDEGKSSSRSSSRFSSFSSQPVCGNGRCENGEGFYCPPCDAFPCTNSCAVGTCPQDCSGSSSSRSYSWSSRSSSSSFVSCFGSDACVPVNTCNAIGGSFVSPGACGNQSQMQAGHYCCRQSSSSSSWIFYPHNNEQSGTQNIQSCGCQTVCDPSGSPCMALCPSQC